MDKLKLMIVAVMVASFGLAGAMAEPSYAKAYCPDGTEAESLEGCDSLDGGGNGRNLMETLNTIINVVIGLIGFAAVVMIIVGGLNYTTSNGDAQKVKKAKDTILYGIIGLVVALLAYAIVNFVLKNVFTN